MSRSRLFLASGAINGFLAVALGAIGKHLVLNQWGEHAFEIFQTGVHYQMSHAVGLFVVGLILLNQSQSFSPFHVLILQGAGWLFLLGILLFSGSLYLLAVTDIPLLARLTPVGGFSLLTAWILLLWACLKIKDKSPC